MIGVRRAIAASLLFVMSLPLMTMAEFAQPQSKLPACCRRDGKHHCSMMDARDMPSDSTSSAIKAAKTKCASFPISLAAHTGSAIHAAPVLTFDAPAVFPRNGIKQTEARYRMSFSRTRQKRGPPSFLS